MKQPVRWRMLKRHEEGADHRDLTPQEREQMLEGIKKYGVMFGRKVTLHEGKVLDGWQLYQACIDADIKPPFAKLPKGIEPAEFVRLANDVRRHEDEDDKAKRTRLRQERVAKLREDGESLRSIAEKEDISPAQVGRDLEQATKEGFPTTVKMRKVKGRDKKTYTVRDPGDDTEAHKQARKNRRLQGKPLYDWSKFSKAFTVVVQLPDRLAKAYPDQKASPEFNGISRLLKEIAEQVKKWRKKIAKE